MQIATAKPIHRTTAPRRWRRRLLLLALLGLAGALVWFWRPLKADAVAGAAYGARVTCSCRFIAGRELSDCGKDLRPGMGWVRLSEDAETKSVTAWVPLLSSQTATFRAGAGCALEKWEG